jgi:hypothetical protein
MVDGPELVVRFSRIFQGTIEQKHRQNLYQVYTFEITDEDKLKRLKASFIIEREKEKKKTFLNSTCRSNGRCLFYMVNMVVGITLNL